MQFETAEHNETNIRHMYKSFIMLLSMLVLAEAAGAADTADAAPEKRTYLYAVKDADSLYLDHYVSPVAEGRRPCMIFVFGGGFVGGTRDNAEYLPYFDFLTRKGYDVVSIDYRLGLKPLRGVDRKISTREMVGLFNNAVSIAVEDLFSATLFVLDNAEEWMIDTDMIVTCGSSAGAITVLQAENAVCNRTVASAVLPKGFNYAGVISFAGAIFSVDGAPKWENAPAPVMFFHGNADNQVPFEKASLLGVGFYGSKFIFDQFEKRDWPCWFYTLDYQDHAMAVTPMDANRNEIMTFLDDFVRDGRRMTIETEVRSDEFPPRNTKFKVMDYVKANYSE
ncbi:alpha/beta hydrolase [Alistipes sp. Z76]|nr:alpha/beta hydrolase [Alistipes sp. Z76]NCE70569.1 alpha/beta hydrolase [Muribaculaceae bacterium M3]